MWVHAVLVFHLLAPVSIPRGRNGNEKLLIFRSDLLVETKREARSYVVEKPSSATP